MPFIGIFSSTTLNHSFVLHSIECHVRSFLGKANTTLYRVCRRVDAPSSAMCNDESSLNNYATSWPCYHQHITSLLPSFTFPHISFLDVICTTSFGSNSTGRCNYFRILRFSWIKCNFVGGRKRIMVANRRSIVLLFGSYVSGFCRVEGGEDFI